MKSSQDPDDALRLVADPRRQEILRLAWDGEVAATTLARHFDDITPSAVSQHCRKLRDAGLLDVRQGAQDGRTRYYRANKERLGPLAGYLEAFWRTRLETLTHLAEGMSDEAE